jgi:molybdate transport system substrate-binding protein
MSASLSTISRAQRRSRKYYLTTYFPNDYDPCRMVRLALLITFSLISWGCGASRQIPSDSLLVAAASDLTKVSKPLAAAYSQLSGRRVSFVFGASGQLEQQIRHGASFDIFAPASPTFCLALQRDGMLAGEISTFGRGRLVAWSKSSSLAFLQQLTEPRIQKIAIANPKLAPYGMAARQALEAAGLWSQIEPKIVYAESVAHALQLAETGNAEVALVSQALVRDGSFLTIDQKLYQPIQQSAAVLDVSAKKAAAKSFVDFLTSAQAQRILHDYGFGRP